MYRKESGVRVLSQRMATRLKNRGLLWCASSRCSVPFRVGDLVYSSHSSRRRIFHLPCWEALFIETKDDSLKVEVKKR